MYEIAKGIDRLAKEAIIKGVRYRTSDAFLLAHDGRYCPTTNTCDFPGRFSRFLFRGRQGHFFELYLADWRDARDRILPVNQEEAIALYQDHRVKVLTFAEAFPGVTVQEA